MRRLSAFVKERRIGAGMTQPEFADRTGVGLPIIRKIEQGKTDLNLNKVNQVLLMFGHELAPVKRRDLKP